MTLEVRRRLYELFFTTKGIGGTGLGLWISREIIDCHKDRLSVRTSAKPGHSGTVFSLFLPFQSGIGAPAEEAVNEQ